MSDPRNAIDYPNLSPDLWIIWGRGIGHIPWPDPRRRVVYRSMNQTISPRRIPIWTKDWSAAAVFDCEQSGKDWILEKFGHLHIVHDQFKTTFLTPVTTLQFIEYGVGNHVPEPKPVNIEWSYA